MALVLLRDDDANATTDPEHLERAYAPLFDAGMTVNRATIPAVNLRTLAPDGKRERFIHPDAPMEDRCVELQPETPLLSWLARNHAHTDVLVHGYTHTRRREGTEFGALTQPEAEGLLDAGIAVMERALGFRPKGFVAPWDALSGGALRALAKHFSLVSTGWVDCSRLPRRAWLAHVVERLGHREALRVRDAWFLRHRGGKLTPDLDPARVPQVLAELVEGTDIAVVVLHHWMFWDENPHRVIRALANSLRLHRTVNVRGALEHLDALPPWRKL